MIVEWLGDSCQLTFVVSENDVLDSRKWKRGTTFLSSDCTASPTISLTRLDMYPDR